MKRRMFFPMVLGALVIAVIAAGCTSAPNQGTPVPTTTAIPTTNPVTSTASPGATGGQTVSLVAKNLAFDKSVITVPAGSTVTMHFDNQDAGIPHNFALYDSVQTRTVIFQGEVVTGPKTIEYTFAAPSTPGDYFFRCDVHPEFMTGTFRVT